MSILYFQIEFHTSFGQELYICGSIPELGNLNENRALKLNYSQEFWNGEVEIMDLDTSNVIKYYYFVKEKGSVSRREWGEPRELPLEKGKNYTIKDSWKEASADSYLFSSVFTQKIFPHQIDKRPTLNCNKGVLLQVICPYTDAKEEVAICGETDSLGIWNPEKALSLAYIGDSSWEIFLDEQKIHQKVSYKFVIRDKKTKQIKHWEDGENRNMCLSENHGLDAVQVEKYLHYRYNCFSFKGTGTAIPVFSLRSSESAGIGDFLDLRKMIDWVSLTGQQVVQILPINDTTTTGIKSDSYPYNAISCFALHPIYLGLSEYPLRGNKMGEYLKKFALLNELEEIDYRETFLLKNQYIRDLFVQEGYEVLNSREFKQFFIDNQFWLFSYACYSLLRDKYKTADFTKWGEFADYDETKLRKIISESVEVKNEFHFYCFVQFLLDKQLKDVALYARGKGVALKGDLPIGVNRNSVDVWTKPHLFNLNTQTGAPPDDFSVFGQNWGFPTYNWAAMRAENYDWWRKRFKKMTDFFDMYRIDHILGFFRIWEIPLHSIQGLLGHFYPALPYKAEELRDLGLFFDEKRMTEPFIHNDFLNEVFGSYTDEVKNRYLDRSSVSLFALKEEFNTQRKIRIYFSDKKDDKSISIRDGLFSLCNEVLFVRDREQHNSYHPRISAQDTYSYRYLSDEEKRVYDRLYFDFYYHRHNDFWRSQAIQKLLPLINSTPMLTCGEDLGMIPHCVPSVMNEMQILSLEIQRMPKNSDCQFSNLEKIPYLSVCSTSTHDISPIRLWWQEIKEIRQHYYNENLKFEGVAPEDCTAEICSEIIRQHLNSPAMWVILPWQDWMSISEKLRREDVAEERINIPSNPNHYWCYRMHITIEQLLQEEVLNKKIREFSKRR